MEQDRFGELFPKSTNTQDTAIRIWNPAVASFINLPGTGAKEVAMFSSSRRCSRHNENVRLTGKVVNWVDIRGGDDNNGEDVVKRIDAATKLCLNMRVDNANPED